MTGERLAWWQMADRLGMSLQRCQRETTSTEFLEWLEYVEQDIETPKRMDFYLAQIAAEIRRGVARNPNSVKLEHFLLNLTLKGKRREPLTETEKQMRMANSKAAWYRAAGKTPPKEW